MIVGYGFIAMLASVVSTAPFWSHGAIEALVAAPIGGSVAALAAATWVLMRGLPLGNRRARSALVRAEFVPVWTAEAHC